MKSGLLFIAIVLIAIGVVSLATRASPTPPGRKFSRSAPSRRPRKRTDDPAAAILGGLALAGGVVLLVAGARR